MDFNARDVVIGGAHGYAEHINEAGTHQQHIELRDDDNNLMEVWGACFAPNGDAFFALGQIGSYEDYTPNDICYIPGTDNPKEFAVIIGRTNDTIELWRYDEDGNILEQFTGLDQDAAWVHTEPLKLCVACDGTTVYYTDQHESIFSFDLNTGTQNPVFDVHPDYPNFVYAGIDIQKDGDLYVAMTTTGVGPRRDVSIGDASNIWTDKINETPIVVQKRNSTTEALVLDHTVSLDPSDVNSEVLSIAAYYYPCGGGFFMVVTVIGAN
jgi:hypothetical protein